MIRANHQIKCLFGLDMISWLQYFFPLIFTNEKAIRFDFFWVRGLIMIITHWKYSVKAKEIFFFSNVHHQSICRIIEKGSNEEWKKMPNTFSKLIYMSCFFGWLFVWMVKICFLKFRFFGSREWLTVKGQVSDTEVQKNIWIFPFSYILIWAINYQNCLILFFSIIFDGYWMPSIAFFFADDVIHQSKHQWFSNSIIKCIFCHKWRIKCHQMMKIK